MLICIAGGDLTSILGWLVCGLYAMRLRHQKFSGIMYRNSKPLRERAIGVDFL